MGRQVITFEMAMIVPSDVITSPKYVIENKILLWPVLGAMLD